MSRINLTGTIVPSYYDMDDMKEYIDKGLIIPESEFARRLDGAAKNEPLEVYVNSPGGSVFSGYEMKNMVTRWQMDNNQPVEITLGAMAASAASTFALASGAKIRAHENAKMMFHGCTTGTWGGKGAHEDHAELIGKIDAETMERLTGKYGVAPETVQEWFSEGRMGWLTAQEAKALGIVSEIIEESAEVLRFSNLELAALSQGGLAMAAMFDGLKNVVENDTEPESEETETEPDTEPEPDAPDVNGLIARAEQAVRDELTQAHEAAIAAMKADHDKQVDNLNAALNKKQSTIDKINEDLKQANSRILRVSPNRSVAQIAGGVDGEMAWKDALTACAGDYVQARKRYPKSYENYMKQSRQGA